MSTTQTSHANGRTAGSEGPLVSVILPTYNGGARILQAIESVLDQDYRNLELVVVDDASTDDTCGRVEAIDDARLSLIRQEVNGGAFTARVAALNATAGPLVAFIDDDDAWRPGKLRRQVDLMLARPEIGLVHGAVIDVFPDGARRLRAVHRRANDYAENLCQDRLATSTVLVRRSAIDAAGGFDTTLRAFGDWDLWVRILREHPAAAIAEPLATISLRAGSIQRSSVDRFDQSRRLVLDRRQAELRAFGLQRKAESLHHYAVAAKLQQAGRPQEARQRILRSLKARLSPEAIVLLPLTFMAPQKSHWTRLQLRRARSLLRL